MVYRAIGVMSGSSLDGLDIAFATFQEQAGKWTYEILEVGCYEYPDQWVQRLKDAPQLSARDYQLLHVEYGHYIGEQLNRFIHEHQLHYQVSLIAFHGHTTFHMPAKKMTAQLGDGAAIAAATQLPVVSDLRALDVALGGQGAPIVPIGEKFLFPDYDFFINIGGIANLSVNTEKYIAFDICPANRVLNMLANDAGKEFDEDGRIAANGTTNKKLLDALNLLDYYTRPYPKSLDNEFGTGIIYPMIKNAGLSIEDSLRTYTEHIAFQISQNLRKLSNHKQKTTTQKLLVTGGGAFNSLLTGLLREYIQNLNIELIVPDPDLISYKEALIMAFIAVLRWRQEINVLSTVTGSSKDSIGGALWMGDS